MKKSIAVFFLSCLILYPLAEKLCVPLTDGFTIARIHSALPHHPEWETPSSEEETNLLKKICSQPFTYLGFGGQCYAFVSEDNRYVIKFFKHKIRAPWSYLYALTFPPPLEEIRKRKLDKILAKLDRDFTSYKLSYQELQEETGILYVHLNKTDQLHQKVTILDKLHIAHEIDLDQIEFIVQKKAELAYTYLDKLIAQNNLPKIQAAIDSLLHVVISRCRKGIFDEDAKIHRNFGFIDGKAVVIDVGRFRKDPSRTLSTVIQSDLKEITRSLELWVDLNCPELKPWLSSARSSFVNLTSENPSDEENQFGTLEGVHSMNERLHDLR